MYALERTPNFVTSCADAHVTWRNHPRNSFDIHDLVVWRLPQDRDRVLSIHPSDRRVRHVALGIRHLDTVSGLRLPLSSYIGCERGRKEVGSHPIIGRDYKNGDGERVGKTARGERVVFFVGVARSVTYDNVDIIAHRPERGKCDVTVTTAKNYRMKHGSYKFLRLLELIRIAGNLFYLFFLNYFSTVWTRGATWNKIIKNLT